MPSQCEKIFSLRGRKIVHYGQPSMGLASSVEGRVFPLVDFNSFLIRNLHFYGYLGDGSEKENG